MAESYLRLLEASRLVEVATTSVTQLEAQQRQARSLLANGVIGKNDTLRADLALAGARQRLIQSKGQVVLARGRLSSAMGLASGVEIDAAPIAGEPPPSDEPSVASAEAHAVASRLELREISRRIEQEKLRVGVAKLRRLPQVNLVGNYTHAEGSAFAQKDAAYVGGTLTWDVWDWGTTSAGVREADVKRQQAELAQRKLGDEVRLEARQAFVEAASAREALDVARAAARYLLALSRRLTGHLAVVTDLRAALACIWDDLDNNNDGDAKIVAARYMGEPPRAASPAVQPPTS